MPLRTAPIITRDLVCDALALARRCFDENAGVTEESRALFYRTTEFAPFFGRMLAGELKLWGCADTELRAVGALRSCEHVAFIFADARYRRMGLEAALLEAMREEALTYRKKRLTAEPTPDEVSLYEWMGFRPTGGEQTRGGLTFVPVELLLDDGFAGPR